MRLFLPLRCRAASVGFVVSLFLSIVGRGESAIPAPSNLSDAENSAIVRSVTAADDERVAAILAADGSRLDASFSDQLRYGHANGRIDDKASYISQFTTRRSLYESYRYKERVFHVLAPEVAEMTGRVLIHVHRSDGSMEDLDLNFLALWQKEKGQWKFLASQSTRVPAAK